MGNFITRILGPRTTIDDLPDDMLHEIFGRVLAAEPPGPPVDALEPATGAHLALRCVCRRWRDIADWVRQSTATLCVDTAALGGDVTLRPQHAAAIKSLALQNTNAGHSIDVARAVASLVKGSPDVRRVLIALEPTACCLPALVPAVPAIAACTALTELRLVWGAHIRQSAVPANVLAPLSALRSLDTLSFAYAFRGIALPKAAVLAPLPALPDAPRLTCLALAMSGNFVPVGSAAALGRVRRLEFVHNAPKQELLDAEDPFLLRAAADAGAWQPSRLTGLQELRVTFRPVSDSRAPARPARTRARAGSEWAPLAGQVTKLLLHIESGGYKRPYTGIVAGLGALTALRDLRVTASLTNDPAWLEPVSIDRVHAPDLTSLVCGCVLAPASVTQFPNLVHLVLVALTAQPPLVLRSLVARSSLKTLMLVIHETVPPGLLNLAALFDGGGGWPVLERLHIENMVLEWRETGLVGAPTAVEFAQRARQLLPALVRVEIDAPRHARLDWSNAGFETACHELVLQALLGLRGGGRRE